MAEDEFGLDDDLEDDLDTDFGDDEGEQSAEIPQNKGLFTRRRIIIIGAIVGVVFVFGALLFGTGLLRSKPKPQNTIQTAQQKKEAEKEAQVKVEEKKKKKKIKYQELYSNIEPEPTSKILRELSFAKISFKTEQNGNKFTILVDRDQLIDAQNLLAVKGLPSGGVKGYELLDNSATLGVTEFDKRIRFLRALSGELEKAIMQFEMIENAKVQIVLPEQRLFAVTQPPVTASILIRKMFGAELNDDVVFGVIQLVSNAVENLQPENVSVIDTEGFVLSEGIFERIAARKAGTYEEPVLEEPEDIITEDEAVGQPIIPDFVQIDMWYTLKEEFEKNLEEKAMRQLMGVLPLGGYKVAINSDLGPLENGEIVDVRRLAISVVVDNNNEDIFLDQTTKQQIFQTVSGATGYIRGRDTIQLSLADFTLLTEEERKELERFQNLGLGLIPKILLWLLGVGTLGSASFFGYRFYKARRDKKSLVEVASGSTDFSGIQSELNTEKNVDKVKAYVQTDPQLIASVIDKWLGNVAEAPAEPLEDLFESEPEEEVFG